MKGILISVSAALLGLLFFAVTLPAQESREMTGESLFKKHCSACHPDGGNILSPQKTLSKKDREANGIMSGQDIVRKMRNPGAFPTHPNTWSGMKVFNEKSIPDEDALKIADYILKTFN